jgi:hypothetical protein
VPPVVFVPGFAKQITALLQYIKKKIVQAGCMEKAGKTSAKREKTKKKAAFSAFFLEKHGTACYIDCSKKSFAYTFVLKHISKTER